MSSLPAHLVHDPVLDTGKKQQDFSATDAGDGIKVDAFGQRIWDKDFFQQKAEERAELEDDDDDGTTCPKVWELIPADQRIALQRRTQDVNYKERVGKQWLVDNMGLNSTKGGYYCPVCDCTVADSVTWLDHLNGRKHNRRLGMSMDIPEATLEDVMEMIDRLRQEKKGGLYAEQKTTVEDVQAKIERAEELARQKRQEKKDKKERKRQRKFEEEMERGGVQGLTFKPQKKQKKDDNGSDDQDGEAVRRGGNGMDEEDEMYPNDDDEDGMFAETADVEEGKPTEDDEQEEEDPNLAMMRAMGLPINFGGTS